MNIAVIAANGRTGKAFVKAALEAGHTVRAGSLNPGNLPAHPQLTEAVCDATNISDLHALIEGQDAVASFIGHVKGSARDVQTVAIQALIKAMKELDVKRVVSLTGTGVRFPGDDIPFIDRFLNFGVGLIDPARIKDGRDYVELLKQSNLDWTLIRVLKLQNVPLSPFTLREHGPTKLYVGRDEVALAALKVLKENSFVKQAPIISRL